MTKPRYKIRWVTDSNVLYDKELETCRWCLFPWDEHTNGPVIVQCPPHSEYRSINFDRGWRPLPLMEES